MAGTVFLLCLAAGLACGIAEGALSPLRKSAGIVFTVITDVITAFALVGSHAAIMYFYGNGLLFPYAIAAQALCFFIMHALVTRLFKKIGTRFKKKTPKARASSPSPLD